MRVVVTGGTGNIGRYVCDELTEAGYETIAVDRAKPRQGKVPARFVQADLTSLDETLKALSGAGQVVHLAAIPNPANDPPEVVLRDNTTATYNVFEAARRHGIPRVVYASSESATGFGIHEVKLKPQYVPIDEAHPCWPHECYSLSKYLGEQIAQGYGQAYGIECIALRWCGVWDRRVADWVPQLIERTESGDVAALVRQLHRRARRGPRLSPGGGL